jgi:hypothetical protein
MAVCMLGRRLALGRMLKVLIPPLLAREEEKSDTEIRGRFTKLSGILDGLVKMALAW